MSKKQNRVRARRARQQQELLSLRAELLLLYDGAPMPIHYLEVDRLQTRELVRAKKFYEGNTPNWMRPPVTKTTFDPVAYKLQIDTAAEKLRQDIDRQLIADLKAVMGSPSLDK